MADTPNTGVPEGVTFGTPSATPAPTQNVQGVPPGVTFGAPPLEADANKVPGQAEYGSDQWYQEKLGQAVPQAAVPALQLLKKGIVDPFEKLAAWGGEKGGEAAQNVIAHPFRTVISPESALGEQDEETKKFVKEHPRVSGVAAGVGTVAGSVA